MALTFDDTQAAALLDALGLPPETTDIATILATVTDAVTACDTVDAKPSTVAAAAKRAGLDVIDPDTLTALRADAAEGRQIKAAAAREKVEAAVTAAISKGKITAGRRKHWVDLITADPGMADVLASVPDETAVPMTPIGHGIDISENSADTADGWFY